MRLMPAGRRRRSEENDKGPGSPLWMTTYGDLITQILIFFVLLYSLSSIDTKKFDLAMTSLQGSLGILQGGKTYYKQEFIESGTGQNYVAEREKTELEKIGTEIEKIIESNNLRGIKVDLDERGLTIRFLEGALFDSGKAVIKDNSKEILDKIAPILKDSNHHIRVEGHTDNVPIHTREFPSNWELSTARAVNVVRYFIEVHGINPKKISAAGYGEYRPVVPNDTDKNRALNRRVDIIILKSSLEMQEPN
ncbi:Motility protein B [Thermovenabulum gondwanense]|uniref:Motility protein B n=2 Tax=Thermovenabulum gondwanense TaxID=520767 RepID=A0A162M997_9FIRM|nr:Motility protein B [Thermovenabulum gondwanense]